MKFAHRLREVFVIGKSVYFFRAGVRTNFLMGDFPHGRKFPRGELFRGSFTLEDFARVPIRNSFYLSYILFAKSILHLEMLMIIVRNKFSPGLNCLKDLSVEGIWQFRHNLKVIRS